MIDQKLPRPNSPISTRRNIIIGGFVIAILFTIFYILPYGFKFPPCEYTDQVFTTDFVKDDVALSLTKDHFVGLGKEKGDCSEHLKHIDRQIIVQESIDNPTIGKRYFENRGVRVDALPANTAFKIKQILIVTKHGLGTIDSGSGPEQYLILSDGQERLYKIAFVDLGESKPGEAVLTFVGEDGTRTELNREYMENIINGK